MKKILTETRTGVHILIDYFSATFPFICYEEDSEYKIINDILMMISEFIGITKDEIEKQEYSQNRFNYQYRLGSDIVLRLIGPELKSGHKSCSIEMKGEGCREFEEIAKDKTWFDFLEFFLIRLNSAPSRIDLTIDDYEGNKITLPEIRKKLDNNLFVSSFKDKDFIIHGSEKKGITIQFGNRTSSQMLVIYEKLKEQITRGIDCFQTYWLRYEMRYYKDKAYNVCMNILDKGAENYRKYIFGLLYDMLDIKDDNNFDDNNQYKSQTDKSWKLFLEEAEKAKIEKYKSKKSSYDIYRKWASPISALYILNTLLHHNQDIDACLIVLLKDTINFIDDINKMKLKKINNYLTEKRLPKLTEQELYDLKQKIKKIIEIKELPF